jgi:hypothetical protein
VPEASQAVPEASHLEPRALIPVRILVCSAPFALGSIAIMRAVLDRQQKIVRELYGWFNEWSTVAKKVITRRDYLIRLGLAKRRTRKAAPGAGGGGGSGAPEGGG